MGLIRKPHLLKPTKNAPFPTRIIFVDTETTSTMLTEDTQRHDLKLGVAAYMKVDPSGQHVIEWLNGFRERQEFWEWSLEKVTSKQRLVFFAHNLDFDFQVLDGLGHLAARRWHAQQMIISGQVDIWTFCQYKYQPKSKQWDNYVERYKHEPRTTKAILFLDFMNYFKMNLAKLGESIGTTKMEIDFDTCSDAYLLEYCHNDVQVMIDTWLVWTDFLKDNDLGVWGKTLPSQAFNAFRHRFMNHEIYVHSHEECLALERDGYFGGRTECFRIGSFNHGPYYLLDVNSMYPSVMIDKPYPSRLVSYIKNVSVRNLNHFVKSHLVVARVLIHTDEPAYPRRHKSRLIFPTGTFWTVLTTPELVHALERGRVLTVQEASIYEGEPIFHDYVSFFWNERLKAKKRKDTAYTMIYKLLMNSLYGKFGQTLDEYVYLCDDPEHDVGYYREYDCDEGRWHRYKRMNGKIEVFTNKGEAYNSFPAIAAHVTAYARLYLWHFIEQVSKHSLFYTDTDSLIVSRNGYKLLNGYLDDTSLGALSLQNQSESIVINNVKDYVFASKRKIKGVKSPPADPQVNSFSQWHGVSLRSVLWGEPRHECLWRKVDKHLSGEYLKGTVSPDGYVTPFVFQEQ